MYIMDFIQIGCILYFLILIVSSIVKINSDNRKNEEQLRRIFAYVAQIEEHNTYLYEILRNYNFLITENPEPITRQELHEIILSLETKILTLSIATKKLLSSSFFKDNIFINMALQKEDMQYLEMVYNITTGRKDWEKYNIDIYDYDTLDFLIKSLQEKYDPSPDPNL